VKPEVVAAASAPGPLGAPTEEWVELPPEQALVEDYELWTSLDGIDATAEEMAEPLGPLKRFARDPRSHAVFFPDRATVLAAKAAIQKRWPGALVTIYARPGAQEELPGHEDCEPDADGILVPSEDWLSRRRTHY